MKYIANKIWEIQNRILKKAVRSKNRPNRKFVDIETGIINLGENGNCDKKNCTLDQLVVNEFCVDCQTYMCYVHGIEHGADSHFMECKLFSF